MRVRVYGPRSNTHFPSELYAVFFSGVFERCLVLREETLLLVDRYSAAFSSEIFEATLRVHDAAIFFCDGSCIQMEEADYSGTKITAFALRWRFLDA